MPEVPPGDDRYFSVETAHSGDSSWKIQDKIAKMLVLRAAIAQEVRPGAATQLDQVRCPPWQLN
jgi:hypothetical protein